LAPRLFARQAADPAVVERMARDTGSSLDPIGLELYSRLARRPGHVAAALRMMAGWDLKPLARDLPRLRLPLHLVVGGNDRAVRPAEASRVRDLTPTAEVIRLPRLGHLAHEERPDEVAGLIVRLTESDSFP
jgi:magnesium chelatase accessory protein